MRERWELYHEHLIPQRDSIVKLRTENDSIQRLGSRSMKTDKRLEEINNQLEQFNRKLLPTTKIENEHITFKAESEIDNKLRQRTEIIRAKINSGKYYNLKEYFKKAEEADVSAVKDIIASLGEGFGDINSGFNRDYDHSTYSCRYGVASLLNATKIVMPVYIAEFSKDSVFISIGLDDEKKEQFNLPITGIDWNEVYNFVKRFFVDRLRFFQ